jgi:hypothetical protein
MYHVTDTWSNIPYLHIGKWNFHCIHNLYIRDKHRLSICKNWVPRQIFRRSFVLKISVLWDVTPCSLIDCCHNFRGNCPLHIQSRRSKQCFHPEHWYLSTRQHSITSQKRFFIVTILHYLYPAQNICRVIESRRMKEWAWSMQNFSEKIWRKETT